MTPAKVNIGVACFCYGGNGGIASMSPMLSEWLCRFYAQCLADPRIDYVGGVEKGRAYTIYSDTPIPMVRNRAVQEAKAMGFDFLLMLDNDNEPDGYWNPAGPNSDDVKPFWDSSFDFAYERLMRKIPTVIVAPYCGPPPHPVGRPGWIDGGEVPYLFWWTNNESDNPHVINKISMLTRNEASRMAGIHPIAGGPTGVSLWSLNVFNGMKHPHFYYEYDENQTEKRSTEDCTATRDVALFWRMTKGYDVLFANCDAWALHCKTKHVGRPTFTAIETVGENFAESIRQNWSGKDRMKFLQRNDDLPREGQVLSKDQTQAIISDEFIEQRLKEDAEREAANKLPASHPAPDDPKPDAESIAAMQEAVEAEFAKDKPHESNGIFVRDRLIAGRLVKTVGRELPDAAVQSIENLAVWCVDERGNVALDTAVIHSDTGQAAAAILPALPEGSHLYCLDNLGAREHGGEKAIAFSDAFKPELETGRVMADIESRNFPVPQQKAELDLVFIERYVTRDWLEIWQRHLKPNGILAGFAGSRGEEQIVRDYAEANGLLVNIDGGVFAVPMTIENYA